MTDLPDLTEEQLAADPQVGLLRLVFGFLLQRDYHAAAATLVAEYISEIHRIENAEGTGSLSVESVKVASVLWRRQLRSFKYWFGAADDSTITRMMQELTDKGMATFVSDLAVELQVNPPGSQDQHE